MLRNPLVQSHLSPKRPLLVVVLFFVVAFGLGCVGQARDTERLLAAAGFQMRLADSADRQTHLSTLTQRKLAPHTQDGSLRYVYADDKYCKCVYVGTEEAYQRYERFVLKQRVANTQLEAAQMNADASMNWGMWGPWGPWY